MAKKKNKIWLFIIIGVLVMFLLFKGQTKARETSIKVYEYNAKGKEIPMGGRGLASLISPMAMLCSETFCDSVGEHKLHQSTTKLKLDVTFTNTGQAPINVFVHGLKVGDKTFDIICQAGTTVPVRVYQYDEAGQILTTEDIYACAPVTIQGGGSAIIQTDFLTNLFDDSFKGKVTMDATAYLSNDPTVQRTKEIIWRYTKSWANWNPNEPTGDWAVSGPYEFDEGILKLQGVGTNRYQEGSNALSKIELTDYNAWYIKGKMTMAGCPTDAKSEIYVNDVTGQVLYSESGNDQIHLLLVKDGTKFWWYQGKAEAEGWINYLRAGYYNNFNIGPKNQLYLRVKPSFIDSNTICDIWFEINTIKPLTTQTYSTAQDIIWSGKTTTRKDAENVCQGKIELQNSDGSGINEFGIIEFGKTYKVNPSQTCIWPILDI